MAESFILAPNRRFETQEDLGHRITVHLGAETPGLATRTAPVIDVTFFASPGQLDWLRVGRPVRLTLQPFESKEG
jgi:hypothetical protein